jgi:iron complex outermembrane recepter protein
MSNLRVRTVVAGILSVTGLQAAGAAFAADDIAEVVVTAQRREQRLQDVPVAVSVVAGAELEREDIKSLQDLTRSLANVMISTGTLTNSMTVRGVGSGNNSGFEQSVATFADGVYRPRSRATNAALLDIERVEVLKGPQTTFFGANAIAGALNITTRKPGNEFTYNGSALYGFNDGEYNLEGGMTLPASDTLSFRVAARVSGMDGYVTMRDGSKMGPNDDSKQGRVAVRWRPGDVFESNFRLDIGTSRTDEAVPLEALNCPPGAPYPAPLPPVGPPSNCALALLTNPKLESSLNFHSDSPPSWYAYDFKEAAFTNTWTLEPGTITSITSYFDHEANNRTQLVALSFPGFTAKGYDPLPSEVREKYHQASQELRFTSKSGGRFEYMFGAYYAKAGWTNTSGTGFFFIPFGNILSGPPFNMPATPGDAFTGVPLITTQDKTVSGFASATIHATDALRINLGARYSRITKDGQRSLTFGTSTNNQFGTFVPFANQILRTGACIILTCDNNPFTPANIVNSKFMPSAGLQYDVSKDLMTYVTFTTGFKAGGFSGAATSNTFGPEKVDSYEAGIKGSFFDRRLTLNADVFRMNYTGLQETAYTQTLASIVLNAAESVSQGLEVNGDWRVSEALRLHADLAYLDSTYQNFRNAPCTSLSVLKKTCGTATTGPQDMSGKRRANAPEFSGGIGATAQYMVAGRQLRIDPSLSFTTEYFLNAAADPLLRQGGYTQYNLRVGYGPEDSRWEVALVGKNLGDKAVKSFALEMPGSLGTTEALPERGRNIALQVSVRH